MIKNPTGDALSKAPNLVDLFANRKEALAKAGQPAEARKTPAGRGSRNELPPLETAAKKSEAGANPSFQARVKESRAKLASGSHKFFAQGKSPESRRNDAATAPKSGSTKVDAQERSEAARSADFDRRRESAVRESTRSVEETSDTGAATAAGDRRTETGRKSNRGSGNPARETEGRASPEEMPVAAGDTAAALGGSAPYKGEGPVSRSEAAIEELKNGLESLGISVTREQLDDPVFLADMLEMLQNMGAPAAMDFGAVPAAIPVLAEAESPEGMPQPPAPGMPGLATETPGSSAPTPASPVPTSGAPAAPVAAAPATEVTLESAPAHPVEAGEDVETGGFSRKEAAALIRDRINELTRNPSDEAGGASARAVNVPSATPGVWQGVAVRPHGESSRAEALPMADLDRLRVLQASALQANAAGKESAPTLALESDAEPSEAAEDGGVPHPPSAEQSDASAGDAGNGPYGRKEDGFKNPDLALRKDMSALPKDGAPGPQFVNALDQARAPEHRTAVERAWSPHHPAFEKSVLDQISRKMSGTGLKSGEELSIQLAPENLGKVRISLEMKEGVMSARIGVENESVRQVVESNLAGLRDSLEAQGVKLQGLDVSVDQRHGSLFNPDGSNAESFFRGKGRGEDAGAGGAETPPFESAPESDTGRRLGYNTLEFIG